MSRAEKTQTLSELTERRTHSADQLGKLLEERKQVARISEIDPSAFDRLTHIDCEIQYLRRDIGELDEYIGAAT